MDSFTERGASGSAVKQSSRPDAQRAGLPGRPLLHRQRRRSRLGAAWRPVRWIHARDGYSAFSRLSSRRVRLSLDW